MISLAVDPPRLHAVASAADRSAALSAGLPAVFAGTTFDPADPVLADVCGSSSRVVLRTGMLPLAMHREIFWWVATCHANGERVINTSEWNQWAAVAAGDASVRWDNIAPAWLREGVKLYACLQMKAGQPTWSTVLQVRVFAARFGEFAVARGIGHPALVDDPSQLRALALEFRAFLAQWRRERPSMAVPAAARSTPGQSPAPCDSW